MMELITLNLIRPSTHQLLWSSGGGSGPDKSFDKSASPEHLFSKHFGAKIMMTLDIKLHEIADLVMKKYKCIVSHGQRRSAKRWALNEGENTMRDHYGYIRSYAKEILLESNDGSTVRVGVTV
ncbi:hypothetical protein Tco_0549432 [Tanacetum coccineum]